MTAFISLPTFTPLPAILRRLMLPGEMGDAIKVLALTRGDVPVPSGLLGRDMRAAL